MSYDWEKMRKEEWPVLETMTFLDAACVSFAPQRAVRGKGVCGYDCQAG